MACDYLLVTNIYGILLKYLFEKITIDEFMNAINSTYRWLINHLESIVS